MYLRQAKLAINMAKWYHQDMLVKTTLRIKENLKKAAEKKALEEGKSLQSVLNEALEEHLASISKKRTEKTLRWVDTYIKDNRPALEALAKK